MNKGVSMFIVIRLQLQPDNICNKVYIVEDVTLGFFFSSLV
ncbi:hypothetical protein Niako_4967 [Niastella koreensis GR20-10]|uniref:Uncharacterized protein n=1 Tax=Niastella koreensis (strain DSM 17620 / KACC 11465 / NBRC 106392 / GR20-10) TaxID=700598 RepID=G8T8M7_NIAKG|nr:hypothetical protein Niako_4967 [Niastella koreensis GR20-10]